MLGQRYISWIFLLCGVFTFQKDSTTHTSAAMLGNISGTASNSATATKTTTNTPNNSVDNDIHVIISASVSGVLLLLLILCIIICCCLRHKRNREKRETSASNGPQQNSLDGSKNPSDKSVSGESRFRAYDNTVYNSENNSMHTSF